VVWTGKRSVCSQPRVGTYFSCLPFFGPFKGNSLLVHFDGGASLSNFSAAHFINGKLRCLECHWDLKPMSTIYNANALVFAITSGQNCPNKMQCPENLWDLPAGATHVPKLKNGSLKTIIFRTSG